MAELEATFGCPVIESYGMTEAAHQMASNPLPPAPAQAGQRRRSPPGPEWRSWRRTGALLPAGEIGEIVISRPQRHAGLREQPGRQRHGLRRMAGSTPATRA